MAKLILQNITQPTCSRLWIAVSLAFLFLPFPLWCFINPWLQFSIPEPIAPESKDPTFYDDPASSYTIDKPEVDWDRKRSQWFKLHPAFSRCQNCLLLVMGSQPSSCKNSMGDHFLLRFFKNNVNYCKINRYDIFYNNAILHPRMLSVWTKLSPLRVMVAFSEEEKGSEKGEGLLVSSNI